MAQNVGDYAALQTAAGGSSTDDTITLTADINGAAQLDIERNVIIDLNGHSLTINSPSNGIRIDAGVTLTIRDSSPAGANTLTVTAADGAGINTSAGTLIIESGAITAASTLNGAGIGGGVNGDGGTITISGGTVTANGGWGAGIGGGELGAGGTITITGGTVTATGYGGAGIGGGLNADGGTITITGGTVTATGDGGAGIGGGSNAEGGTITITGGTITAESGGGAGIGGGSGRAGGTITISATSCDGLTIVCDKIKAKSTSGGAGIGGGYNGAGGTITIYGGDIEANGGTTAAGAGAGGAGIGSGAGYADSGKITILGNANVTATGGSTTSTGNGGGAGIGSGGLIPGIGGPGTVNTINISTTGTMSATGGTGGETSAGTTVYMTGANIGSGGSASGPGTPATIGPGPVGTIDLSDTSVTSGDGWTFASGVFTVTGDVVITGSTTDNRVVVQSGANVNITLDNASIAPSVESPFDMTEATVRLTLVGANTLTSNYAGYPGLNVGNAILFIMPSTGSLTTVGSSSAGIGSSYHPCGTVIIAGGTVNATGNSGGAGIGGGWQGAGCRTVIVGGTVNATGDGGGAGIGGSSGGAGGLTVIAGGSVTATGNNGGAGIGGGGSLGGAGGAGGMTVITGGTVSATGGNGTYGGGAGIGGGSGRNPVGGAGGVSGAGGVTIITGGAVDATGGNAPSGGGGAGIGGAGSSTGAGAFRGASGYIIISGEANVTATGGSGVHGGAGIGSGGGDYGNYGKDLNTIFIDTTGAVIAVGGRGEETNPGSGTYRHGAAVGHGGDHSSSGFNRTPAGGAFYFVKATRTANGEISPFGSAGTNGGNSLAFTITPNASFALFQVLIDSTNDPSAAASGSYTFTNIAADHTIHAVFVPDSATITIGTQPAASTTVTEGAISGTLSVTASVSGGGLISGHQWYSNTTNSNTGGTAISGATSASFTIPTDLTAVGSPYYYYCVVIAAGATPVASDVAMVTVNPVGGTPLTFTYNAGFDIPASTVGTAIASIDVSGGAAGGTAPYTFSATGLPAGITISAAGVISGTPTAASAAGTATITVTDNATATANITINYGAVSVAGTPLTFTYNAAFDIPASTVGTAITNINVSGGASGGTAPYTFSATGLPAGISINAAGVISGTPTATSAAGTATITVTDNTSATANITINYGAVSVAGTNVTFTATQVGGTSGTADSTGIVLTFDQAVTGLAIGNITVTNGTGMVTTGTLSGTGMTYTVALTSVTTQGDVTVSVSNFGTFNVTTTPQTVAVYKDTTSPLTTISIATINGVTPPVAGAMPVTTITETAQYTGTVTWAPAGGVTFGYSTVYTATITLTPKAGFTLTGVAADFFTVAGTSSAATNAADSGVITAVFPATGAAPDTTINIATIDGVTPPVAGATPVTTITETAQYTGTVTWVPADATFGYSTVYTATITLTPKVGYTLMGVAADFFTVAGTNSATNAANSGVITAVFPATAAPLNTDALVTGVPGLTTPTISAIAANAGTITSTETNATTQVDITATVSTGATVSYWPDATCATNELTGTDVTQFALNVGSNVAYVKVVSEDGNTTNIYTMTITRAAALTFGLNPASLTLTNATTQTAAVTGTATGAITLGALSPANADISVTSTATGVDVTYTGTMPHAGAPNAITSGPHTVTVTRQGVTETLTINVNIPAFVAAPTFGLNPASLTLTNATTQTAAATGSAIGNITAGALNPPNADISVTPTATGVDVTYTGTMPHAGAPAAIAGAYTIPVTRQGVTETLTINVNIPAYVPLTFTSNAAFNIPASTLGRAIVNINVATGVSGGTPPYTFSAAGLPAGISISSAGVISGAPTVAGAAGTATITVSDSASTSQSITITFGAIAIAPLASSATPIPALGPVGLVLLALMLGGMAFRQRRRKM